ncbi:hypothetical protein BPAE_0128g00050 [Botrytis paeoniae]|uniref:Uncharacterized protein n=1 Tax=Botrytis paeoniae TaxID=278948 RepID=A0A4Z1FF83_9HELO|nr:hypothetical protein BPAE_0128g00050 [Botrytis paeoniae]
MIGFQSSNPPSNAEIAGLAYCICAAADTLDYGYLHGGLDIGYLAGLVNRSRGIDSWNKENDSLLYNMRIIAITSRDTNDQNQVQEARIYLELLQNAFVFGDQSNRKPRNNTLR